MNRRILSILTMLLLVSSWAMAQTEISGVVVSEEDGEPIIGASVKVGGVGSSGAITDINGRFSIIVPAGKKIVISYIGMVTQTLTPRNGMRIIMHTDATTLNDVVVTGMQKMDKRLFTGATTKVSAADAKIDGVADISRSLEGRAAGVSVQNVSGTFGAAPKIRVRGATSIYGASKPLWVVDGVILEDVIDVSADDLASGDANTLISSAIAGLNSDDIESFEVLKDGSATSIYGARAMAGVITVTTKKGHAGHSSINYTGEYTMRLKPSYREFNIMNSQDQMSIYQELQQKGYLNYAETANASESGIYGKMYQMLSQYDPLTKTFALENSTESIARYLRDAEYRNTDWFDLLFSNAIQHSHSVSIDGGTDKTTYRASVSIMQDPGWSKQSSVERYTANINADFKLTKQLSLNIISRASYRNQNAPGTLNQNTDPVSGTVSRGFDINPYSYALNTSRALDPNTYYTRNYAPFNIFNELDNNYSELRVSEFNLQGELSYKPVRTVELKALGAIRSASTAQEQYIRENSNQAMAYRAMDNSYIREHNSYLYKDPDNIYALPVSVMPEGGILKREDNNMFTYNFRVSAGYNDVFAEKHSVNLFGALETTQLDRHQTQNTDFGVLFDSGMLSSFNYLAFKQMQERNTSYYGLGDVRERTAAFIFNGTYTFDRRYVVNGTFRYEGTNRMGKNRQARWLPTWNVSGRWNVDEEKWFDKLSPVLSSLNLRASYSLTADRGPSDVTNSTAIFYPYMPWRPFTSVKESGVEMDYPANQELTYEKKHELSIGVDMGFLNNRINLMLDWYKRNQFDLIGPVFTTGYAGGDLTQRTNSAEMTSSGFEVSLSTVNIRKKDFSWSTSFIYSHASNKVTKLMSRTRLIELLSSSQEASLEGYARGSLFSIPFAGLNKEGLPTFSLGNGQTTVTGIYFQETDPEEMKFLTYSGTIDPTDYGSLGNTLKYKGLTLNVFLTYSFGNVIRLDRVFASTYSDLTAMPKEFENRWMVPGDEKKTDVPVIASARQNRNDTDLAIAYNAYNYSTARVAKGDFVRMKEISLNYDFPKNLISSVGLTKLSLKLQATNLFLIYSDKKLNGQDPEFINAGGVATPMPKQFTMTLRLGL